MSQSAPSTLRPHVRPAPATSTNAAQVQKLTPALMWTMATAAGAGVANVYYNQPLLDQIRASFGVSTTTVGWVPTLTQLGYALGMLLLVPLGDMMQRKRLVLFFTVASAFAALGIALAPGLWWLMLASGLFGLSTMTPQLLVPFAAHLAPADQKGRVVGFMVSGVLLGILLARTVSGFVGGAYGWRVMFGLAAGVQAITALALWRLLPRTAPTYGGTYLGLLRSVWGLLCRHGTLREATLFGAMLFGSFMAFWSCLIHLMESPAFHLGPQAVGLYGLLGAGAALLSPLIGSLGDRTSPRRLTGVMIALAIASYGVFYWGRASLVAIGVGVLLMDIGVQMGHVTNQGRIFRLDPHAQSRIQTAYMFFYFSGAAAGSLLGGWAWSAFGWAGVCLAAVGMLAVAGVRWLLPAPRD